MLLLLGKTSYQLGRLIKKNVPIISKCSLMFCSTSQVETVVTPENDPTKYTKNDIGLFYTLPNSLSFETLFSKLFHFEFYDECVTFGETRFLIRKPALEILNYMKNADYDAPPIKYVLYGKHGSGKTFTLFHLIYYAYVSKWLIIHCPGMEYWLHAKKPEKAESITEEGCLDLPTIAAQWLVHFRRQNESLIKNLNLQIQNDYSWNIKEKNLKGESLMSIIDHGITRTKYACDVIKALISEIKELSKSGKIKTLVCIDSYDLTFNPFSKIRNTSHELLPPDRISCIKTFKDLTKSDWNNAAVVVTCSTTYKSNNIDDHLPLKQFGTKGFDSVIPFVPVEVPPLSDREIKSVLMYYRSKKWLLSSESDEEIKFLCSGNHLSLRRICDAL